MQVSVEGKYKDEGVLFVVYATPKERYVFNTRGEAEKFIESREGVNDDGQKVSG